MEKNCLVCSKLFIPSISNLKKRKCLFCSLECYWESKRKQYKKLCLFCGKEYTKNKNVNPKTFEKSKFCSNICAIKNNIPNRKKGEKSNNWKGGKKVLFCKVCNKSFGSYSKQLYCTQQCAYSDTDRSKKIIKIRQDKGTFYNNEKVRKSAKKFDEYKASAKRRKKDFQLKKNEFIKLALTECTYCGEKPAYGVDRVNSSDGYLVGNSVPCCKKCNFAKHIMLENEFKQHIIKIYNFYASK